MTPSLVHLNLVEKSNYSNDIPVLGFFARQGVAPSQVPHLVLQTTTVQLAEVVLRVVG